MTSPNTVKRIVVVESPAKAKTITRYLGKQYTVLASYGHVRDLPAKRGSIDPKHNFSITYTPIGRNTPHVNAIAKALKDAEELYIATDPDREGEAIAWHLQEILQDKGLLTNKPVHRVVFHEITRSAITKAIENPRTIAMDLVNAQQARRALDYLVGFTLSPLLWKKIQNKLSAGRVQSPALRLIVEREHEIKAFKQQEYWTLTAHNRHDNQPFTAKLITYQDEKLKQFSITTSEQADTLKTELLKAAEGTLDVLKVTKKNRKRHPPPPYITSTLQQEAGNKLGFTAKRTMITAQHLYEGVDLGSAGTVGLITYMRTDSVHLATEAIDTIRDFITQHYGNIQLPDKPHTYKTKS